MTDDNLSDTQQAINKANLYCDNEKIKEGMAALETYRNVGIDKALAPSVYEKEIWNEAIEAAAKEIVIPKDLRLEMKLCDKVRRLKK